MRSTASDFTEAWPFATNAKESGRSGLMPSCSASRRPSAICIGTKRKSDNYFDRDSPDDSRTGVNIGAFPAFLQDRRKVRTAIDTSRNRNGGRGADLLIFAGIRTHSSRRLLLSA